MKNVSSVVLEKNKLQETRRRRKERYQDRTKRMEMYMKVVQQENKGVKETSKAQQGLKQLLCNKPHNIQDFLNVAENFKLIFKECLRENVKPLTVDRNPATTPWIWSDNYKEYLEDNVKPVTDNRNPATTSWIWSDI